VLPVPGSDERVVPDLQENDLRELPDGSQPRDGWNMGDRVTRGFNLLPVGAYVRVVEHGPDNRTYIGRVRGYDMSATKYHLDIRCGGWGEWLFTNGGAWAFPSEVKEISENEALQSTSGSP
jgi:hypothetical protein